MYIFSWIKNRIKEDKTQKAIRLLAKAAKDGDKRAKRLISLYSSIDKQESLSPIKNILLNNKQKKLTKIIKND